MAQTDLTTHLGEIELRSPLIAASGTVGSVWEWAAVADTAPYGAAVAKSVSGEPWEGRPAPRIAPSGVGMLNGIGIQNPGIEAWLETMAPRLSGVGVPVWGSAVGHDSEEFARVAKGLASAGMPAIEINLSCPNLDSGRIFSFDAEPSAEVVKSVVEAAGVPVAAKLSPNTPDIVEVAEACVDAGADFLTLTNTAVGFGLSIEERRPLLSGGPGGYSGPGLKPLSMRCVYEVAQALPGVPIVGTGGVSTGRDVLEYLIAGASAVGVGTVHLAEPRAGVRIRRELEKEMERLRIQSVSEMIGTVESW